MEVGHQQYLEGYSFSLPDLQVMLGHRQLNTQTILFLGPTTGFCIFHRNGLPKDLFLWSVQGVPQESNHNRIASSNSIDCNSRNLKMTPTWKLRERAETLLWAQGLAVWGSHILIPEISRQFSSSTRHASVKVRNKHPMGLRGCPTQLSRFVMVVAPLCSSSGVGK